MNREEKAFLANIATVLVKDIGIDKKFYPRKAPNILFAETSLDDGFELFVCQIQKKFERKCILKTRLKKKVDIMLTRILRLPSNFKNEFYPRELYISKPTYEKLFRELKKYIPNNIHFLNAMVSQHAIFCSGLVFLLSKKESLNNTLRNYEINEDLFHKILPYFYNSIAKSFEKYVKWPETSAEQTQILKKFCNDDEANKLKSVLGIINCKTIDITLENDKISQSKLFVIQTICDANQLISNVEVEYASSYKFRETKIYDCLFNDTTNKFIPAGSYLLGSSAFPLSAKLITPFRNINDEKKHTFNSILDGYINISEKMFNVIRNRFQILCNPTFKDLSQFKNILKAILVIHNLCIRYEDICNEKIHCENRGFSQYDLCDNKHQYDLDGLIKREAILDAIIT